MKEQIYENQTSDMTDDFLKVLKAIFIMSYGIYDLTFETTGEKDYLVFGKGTDKEKINITFDSYHEILIDVVSYFDQV